MTNYVRAAQARQNSVDDAILFNETTEIMREIIAQAAAGEYTATVSNTPMTKAERTVEFVSTEPAVDILAGDTVIINAETVTLGDSGTSLNAVIGDINDANLSGIKASKTIDNKLVLAYNTDIDSELVIGEGTANSSLGLAAGSYNAPLPDSVLYYNTWRGTETNAKYINQMNSVNKFFETLGYTIYKQSSNNRTFYWTVNW